MNKISIIGNTARRFLGSRDSSSAEISKLLSAAEAEVSAALADLRRLEADKADQILDLTDEAHHRVDDAISAARRRSERAEAAISRLTESLAHAKARETEMAKRARYEAAKSAAENTRADLIKTYPKLAGELIVLLDRCRTADGAVLAANSDLPEGAEPIPCVENFRARPATPAHKAIRTVRRRDPSDNTVTNTPRTIEVDEEYTIERDSGFCPDPLYATVSLPPLRTGDVVHLNPGPYSA